MFYIYVHIRHDTGTVFYVGKGQGKRSHSRLSRNKHWNHIVAKIPCSVHVLQHFDNEQDALDAEIRLIKQYRNQGIALVNIAEGGSGCLGLSGEKNGFYGRKHTDQTKARLAVPKSPETKAKLSLAHKGKKLTEEHKRKIGLAGIGRSVERPVKGDAHHRWAGACHTPFGTFASYQAASDALNIPYQTIVSRCRNPRFVDWSVERGQNVAIA